MDVMGDGLGVLGGKGFVPVNGHEKARRVGDRAGWGMRLKFCYVCYFAIHWMNSHFRRIMGFLRMRMGATPLWRRK